METKIAVLADYASMSIGGKLNVLGVFGAIFAERVPIAHAQMFVVARFDLAPQECGMKHVITQMIDADGKQIISIEQRVDIPKIYFAQCSNRSANPDKPSDSALFLKAKTPAPSGRGFCL